MLRILYVFLFKAVLMLKHKQLSCTYVLHVFLLLPRISFAIYRHPFTIFRHPLLYQLTSLCHIPSPPFAISLHSFVKTPDSLNNSPSFHLLYLCTPRCYISTPYFLYHHTSIEITPNLPLL